MRNRTRFQYQLCLLGLVFLVTYALAVEEKPLPAFSVTRSDGLQVTSRAMTEEDQYVLIYLAPGCRPCDSLMGELKDPQAPELGRRVVVIVKGDLAQAGKYIHDHLPADIEPVIWYADVDESAYHALQLNGTPSLFGIRSGRVEWSISGVMKDSAMVRSVMRKWAK